MLTSYQIFIKAPKVSEKKLATVEFGCDRGIDVKVKNVTKQLCTL